MTIKEAIQTVQSNPSNLNVYYLDKNGTINVIQEVPTSSCMLVLCEEEIRIKNVTSRSVWGFGPETRDYGRYDIPNPLPFDHSSNLDRKKKKQIYDQYKRVFDASAKQLADYGEDSSRYFKIAEEATGAALSTIGVGLTVVFPPAGGLGLIGLAVTTGSATQALYGVIRTYVAYSDQDFLKILDDDKGLKIYMQIVDLASVLFSLYDCIDLLKKLNEARKTLQVSLKYLKDVRKNLDLVNMKLVQEEGNLEMFDKALERVLKENKEKVLLPEDYATQQINILRDQSHLTYQKIMNLRNELGSLTNTLILDMQSFSKLRIVFYETFGAVEKLLNKLFSLDIHYFSDGAGGLLIQLASFIANATEGHGVATGTLNELRKGESIISPMFDPQAIDQAYRDYSKYKYPKL